MSKDEQARARLVEIALEIVSKPMKHTGPCRPECIIEPVCIAYAARARAEMRNPKAGSWCAAGLTAAMEDAGLVVPAPGTSARRGAAALLDFVAGYREGGLCHYPIEKQIEIAQPGDIIAWLQNKAPEEWYGGHAYASTGSLGSMCGKTSRMHASVTTGKRCSSCIWETRKGHVAGIVAVDDESITTVGWNEGKAPGRVMKRRLWRDPERTETRRVALNRYEKRQVPRTSTVLYRRPGGLYGIARPVER